MKKSILTMLFAMVFTLSTSAQQSEGIWQDISDSAIPLGQERLIVPSSYRVLALDINGIRSVLDQTPVEFTTEAKTRQVILDLPFPDGSLQQFSIVESPIMAPELTARFPDIRTYSGQSRGDGAVTCRLDLTPHGFHAIIFTPNGTVYIDPYSKESITNYISYFKRDARWTPNRGEAEGCQYEFDSVIAQQIASLIEQGLTESIGEQLRTYRAAVAATGEYTQFHGGTVALGLAAVVTAMNRVNGIYEREVAIRMTLISNNDAIIYTNPDTDPYSNYNGGLMLGQNQSNLDNVIGNGNYDIGHVFSTGGGGFASLGVVCRTGFKARGVTGLPSPIGDPFYVDYVAHEIGHQFAANHTFNGNESSCGSAGQHNASTAYEPGSGSTIMAYAGICGSQNLQTNSDDYFHRVSVDEIVAYSTSGSGNNCPTVTNTGNWPPVVDAGPSGYTIPINTPFELTGSASDPNNDPLTFAWEQYDLGPAGHPNSPSGNAPIFRSFSSVNTPTRTFPKLSDLLNNMQTIGEILPSYGRTLNFRLTARDNRPGGGGNAFASTSLSVTVNAGPFLVTFPNTAVTWTGGETQTVTWNVANTNLSPVSCSFVRILLSTDGGNTFPITLAASTPNDGSENIVVPAYATNQARVKVAAINNVFFDVSNADFTITTPVIQVTVDQRRELNQQLTGTQVGRWEGGTSFEPYTVPIAPFDFTAGTREVLKGYQQLVTSPSEKYRVWESNQVAQLDSVQNHRGFTITQFTSQLVSRFNTTDSTITIKTDLVDLPGTTGGNITFHDPWYIDYPDPNYGGNLRNRGMQEPRQFHSRSSPFNPNYDTPFPPSNHPYRGVFLNQGFVGQNAVYYSVGAPSPQTIGNFTWNFINWTTTQGSASFQNANAAQTAVVFRSESTTVAARMKAHMASSIPTATGPNNQRKIAFSPPYWGQHLSLGLVYASAGQIWGSYTDNLE